MLQVLSVYFVLHAEGLSVYSFKLERPMPSTEQFSFVLDCVKSLNVDKFYKCDCVGLLFS